VTPLQLIATVIIPALVGVIIGFPAGVVTAMCWASRHPARGGQVPIYRDDTNPTPGRVPLRGREHLSKVGWFLAIAGLLGFLGGVIGVVQSNNTATCLRGYIAQGSVVNQQRAGAAELDRQAIRRQRAVTHEFNDVMIDAVTNPVTDPAKREQARQDFLVKAKDWNARLDEVDRLDAEAEKKRQDNPLPPEPDC
jgi:hypothetical protein